MDDKTDFKNFMKTKGPARPGVKRHWGSSMDELTQRMEEALIAEKAFENAWRENQSKKPVPEYHSPIESHSEVDRRVSAAVADDARTRIAGEDLETLSARRNQSYTAGVEADEAKKVDSTDYYERKISHDLKAMGISEGYRTFIPGWALAMEEDGD